MSSVHWSQCTPGSLQEVTVHPREPAGGHSAPQGTCNGVTVHPREPAGGHSTPQGACRRSQCTPGSLQGYLLLAVRNETMHNLQIPSDAVFLNLTLNKIVTLTCNIQFTLTAIRFSKYNVSYSLHHCVLRLGKLYPQFSVSLSSIYGHGNKCNEGSRLLVRWLNG